MLSTTFAVLRPAPGSDFDLGAGARHLAAEIGEQLLRQRDHVFRFGAIKTDGLDVIAQALFTEIEHLLRCVGDLEQFTRGAVDPRIGRLRGENDGHQKREGVEVFELALGFRIGFPETLEDLADFRRRPRS